MKCVSRLAAHKVILLQLLLIFWRFVQEKWFLMFSVAENFTILYFIYVTFISI